MTSIRPWKLPLVVAAGARHRPRPPLLSAAGADDRDYLLVVVACVPDEEAAAERIGAAPTLREQPDQTAVQVLAPIQIGFLDRWASAVDSAREEAQQRLVTITAALAKAGIAATAKVADEGVVQAVEDEISLFPATELMLMTAGDDDSARVRDASAELRARLLARFSHVVVPSDEGATRSDGLAWAEVRPPARRTDWR